MRGYQSPDAFKAALEDRLRQSNTDGTAFTRKRQLLVFERFLARVVSTLGTSVMLKGGLALELRLERARTTKDIDLRVDGSANAILEKLQAAGRIDTGDFMTFEVVPDPHHPDIQNDGMQYDGLRFRVECKLAGKVYGQPFGVDVVFGEPITGEVDAIAADDTLGFAGIAPPTLNLYPIETHIAEKLHAYTMPRRHTNTRIKDLPDIALLATTRPIDAEKLRAALETTFAFRKTHALPEQVPSPPAAWETPYAAMAEEDDLPWKTLGEVTKVVRAFLEPVLAGGAMGVWDVNALRWRGHSKDGGAR